jgi:hypothetical protein
MVHFGVNWIAIILAMVASMALGMAWYMSLGKQWMAALGKTEEEIRASGGPVSPFIWAAACQLVMAYFIAVLTPALMGSVDVYNGALTGAHMWLGFMVTSMLLNHRYQGQKWSLALIDGGYLLGVALVQGVVIGLFG